MTETRKTSARRAPARRAAETDTTSTEALVPPEQEGQVPSEIVERSGDVPADQRPTAAQAAEIEAAQANGEIPPPLVAPDAPPGASAPIVTSPTDDPPGEGKWVLFNPGMSPVVYDDDGHSIGGNERVQVDVIKADSMTARMIARGYLVKSRAKSDPHVR